jgi:CDGSH-type Zn-finger protein/uncharacterized Fe-S cluster protein YjdI
MGEKIHSYPGEAATVTWNQRRCIHAAECVRGLPAVFDTSKKPWVEPDGAGLDELAAVVARCPTGALKLVRGDGATEPVPQPNRVRVRAGGPLFCQGALVVTSGEGDLLVEDTRVALCRCGASSNKPYCDNSHQGAGFRDAGLWRDDKPTDGSGSGEVRFKLAADGPILVDGPVVLEDAAGEVRFTGSKAALCRCGASQNKPYCDGSHKTTGFKSG